MIRRIRILIRIVMGGAIGCFVGHSLYVLWRYHSSPARYALQSAPWYTSILFSSILTGVFCAIMLLMDWMLGLWIRANGEKEGSHGKA